MVYAIFCKRCHIDYVKISQDMVITKYMGESGLCDLGFVKW